MITIELTDRQLKIIEIVRENEPITSEDIAGKLDLTRSALRPDLSILTMSKILYARPNVGYFFGDVSDAGLSLNGFKDMTVGEVMSMPVSIDEGEMVHSAVVQIFLEDVGTLFVTSKGVLTGVISRKDLLKCAVGGMELDKMPITMAMTRMPNIVYVKHDDPIGLAVHKILLHEIDSLPVVEPLDKENKELKVLGRFSKTNVTRILMKIMEGK